MLYPPSFYGNSSEQYIKSIYEDYDHISKNPSLDETENYLSQCDIYIDLLALSEVIEEFDERKEKLIMMACALYYLSNNNSSIQRRIDYLSSLCS